MPTFSAAGYQVDVDEDGYLVDHRQWRRELAGPLARTVGIAVITDRHLVVIDYLRREFEAHGRTPNVYQVTQEGGVSAQELYALFPGGPVKKAALIAGVKKPSSCV